MKIIAEIISGSHLYSLNTKDSDLDKQGVCINTDLGEIIGLDKNDHFISIDKNKNKKSESIDVSIFELRRFLNLCRKGASHSIELLSAPINKFTLLNAQFKTLVLDNKEKFYDTNKIFTTLCGYAMGERRLMLGERTGLLGSKRKESLEHYGYSPKNAANLLRLLYVGINFFKTNKYIVDCKDLGAPIYDELLRIRIKPQLFNKKSIEKLSWNLEEEMKAAFDNRNKNKDYFFDNNYTNNIILKMYYPLLEAYKNERIEEILKSYY